MYAISKFSARVVTVISSFAEASIEIAVRLSLSSLPFSCDGMNSSEGLNLVLRSNVVAIEREHLIQQFDSALGISQAEFTECKQEKAVHMVPLLQVILEQKQIRERGSEIIDLYFRFHLLLSKIAHLPHEACCFRFALECIKPHCAIVAEPGNWAVVGSGSRPALPGLFLTAHLRDSHSR